MNNSDLFQTSDLSSTTHELGSLLKLLEFELFQSGLGLPIMVICAADANRSPRHLPKQPWKSFKAKWIRFKSGLNIVMSTNSLLLTQAFKKISKGTVLGPRGDESVVRIGIALRSMLRRVCWQWNCATGRVRPLSWRDYSL